MLYRKASLWQLRIDFLLGPSECNLGTLIDWISDPWVLFVLLLSFNFDLKILFSNILCELLTLEWESVSFIRFDTGTTLGVVVAVDGCCCWDGGEDVDDAISNGGGGGEADKDDSDEEDDGDDEVE